VVDHLKYDAFGTITSESNSSAEPHFAYTGRDWDPDVGLYYNRARWYDPKTGRFLSQDPTGFKAGDTNLNRYVWNRPTTLTDPTGGSGGVGGSGGNPPPMPPVPGNGGSDGDYSGAQLNWSASNVTGGDSGEYNVDWDISVSGRSTAMVSLIQLVTASGDLWLGQSTTDPLINYGSGGKFSAPTVCFLEYLGDVPMVNYKAENPDFAKGTFTDQWWEYATDPYTVTPMTVGPNVQPVGPPGTYYVGGDEYTTTTVLALPQKDAQDLTSGWVQRRQHWVFTNPVLKEPIDRWFDTDASLAMPPSTDPSAATDFKLWDELMSHAIASASYAMTASWGGGPSIETYVTAPVPS
jgi:RHS repeat-associated protein